MNFSPSDGLSGEPDWLSLSGQTMSQNLKSPRIWTEGSVLPLCISLPWLAMWLGSSAVSERPWVQVPVGHFFSLPVTFGGQCGSVLG